jgi:predicted nucleic acid-binding Zn ribbon protein
LNEEIKSLLNQQFDSTTLQSKGSGKITDSITSTNSTTSNDNDSDTTNQHQRV